MPPRLELRELLQQLLGPGYELRHELTGAGMSRVFVAREVALDRQVVVKVLPPELVTEAGLARFRREVQVTARLQHPHILPVLSTGGAGELRYYIAPYVASESLRRHLAGGHRLPTDQALAITLELLGAVALAHSHGIIHCDIKPGNVLLSGDHAILADFGIARALHEGDEPHDLTGSSTIDHAAYTPPERARDASADLWAIAVVAHEAITGAVPSLPASPERILADWRAADPALDPLTAPLAAGVIARALHEDPTARFPSAEAFAQALRRAVRATGTFAAIPAPAARRRWRNAA
ncbi:MAG TPA: serine/threonine-protein kinase, partial [Gemmatimonadaceae bacterium]